MKKLSFWQRILIPIFTFVWWNRLWMDHWYYPDYQYRMYVYKVKGWRTAILEKRGERMTSSFCFWWFK